MSKQRFDSVMYLITSNYYQIARITFRFDE